MMARQVEPNIIKADEIYLKWLAQDLKTQKKFYAEGLGQVGISRSKEQDSGASGD
jgi:hypothetical protein